MHRVTNSIIAQLAGIIVTRHIATGQITAAKLDLTTLPFNFTTSEVNTGFTWVDGKTIYKKTINFGALPNASVKTVAHGISGLTYVIQITGIANTPGGNNFMLPHVDPTAVGAGIRVYADTSNVNVFTGTIDRSGYTVTYITLLYTK